MGDMKIKNSLTIATRDSKLAIVQANMVKKKLNQLYPQISVNFLKIKINSSAINEVNVKDKFVAQIEVAVKERRADVAVHSAKDLPLNDYNGFIAAFLPREDARDVLVLGNGVSETDFSKIAIGTSSLRRRFQAVSFGCKKVVAIRGNVDSRIANIERFSEVDAAILSYAGLIRLKMTNKISKIFSVMEFVPAIGQGAICVTCSEENIKIRKLLAPLNDINTMTAVEAEREVGILLNCNCYSPIGAHATIVKEGELNLMARVGCIESGKFVSASFVSCGVSGKNIAGKVAEILLKNGADRFLQLKNI